MGLAGIPFRQSRRPCETNRNPLKQPLHTRKPIRQLHRAKSGSPKMYPFGLPLKTNPSRLPIIGNGIQKPVGLKPSRLVSPSPKLASRLLKLPNIYFFNFAPTPKLSRQVVQGLRHAPVFSHDREPPPASTPRLLRLAQSGAARRGADCALPCLALGGKRLGEKWAHGVEGLRRRVSQGGTVFLLGLKCLNMEALFGGHQVLFGWGFMCTSEFSEGSPRTVHGRGERWGQPHGGQIRPLILHKRLWVDSLSR